MKDKINGSHEYHHYFTKQPSGGPAMGPAWELGTPDHGSRALKGSGKAAHQEVTSVQRDNAV